MTATVSSRVDDPQSITDLRKYEGTLYAENLTLKRISVNEPDREVSFWMQPKGHEDSIVVLPPRAMEVQGFRRLVLKGRVSVTNDPEMERKIDQLSLDETVVHGQKDAGYVLEENSASRDLVEMKCLISGESVWQKSQDVKDGVPPLSEQYKDLAGEFIPSKTVDDGGAVKFIFTRIQTPKLS